MVVHALPQVTAAQELNAGRRAEADGRVDYAIQFYRHLSEHFAGAPEAAEARDALFRLKRRTSPPPEAHVRAGARANPPRPRANGRGGSAETAHAERNATRNPIHIAPVGAGQRSVPPLELPELAEVYLTGRVIANGFAVAGLFVFLAGLLAVADAMLPFDFSPWLPPWLHEGHPFAGPIAAGAGIVLALAGQLARAVFDIAGSCRDLVAIERAKAEHANAGLR